MNILVWLFSFLPWIATQGTDYFMVEKLYMCDDVPELPIKIYLTPRTFTKGFQTVDLNISSPKAIGENTKLKCQVSMEFGHHWQQISSSETDFCYTFKTYVGQLFYDLERAVGIIPGTCPIPKGRYHAVNYTFDFEKLKLQGFAIGRMKFRLESHDKTTKIMNSCIIAIIQNNYVRPICLPLPGRITAKIGDTLLSTGWGIGGFAEDFVDLKKKLFITIISNSECKEKYLDNIELNDAHLCGRALSNNTDVECHGDAGAPLIYSRHNQWQQESIVSFGVGCGSDYPHVYTNVKKYIDWILDAIQP